MNLQTAELDDFMNNILEDTDKVEDNDLKDIVFDQVNSNIKVLEKCLHHANYDRIPAPGEAIDLERCGLVTPGDIFKLLTETRICYEIFLHQSGQELARFIVLFPQLCDVISSGRLFRQRGSYPILCSFLTEQPLAVPCPDQKVFLTPQLSAYLAFMNIQDEQVNPKSIRPPPTSDFTREINKHNFFDIKKSTNLIRDSHPFQNLMTMFSQYPEMLLILGQRISSQTQRIGFYFGYIQYMQSLFIRPNPFVPNSQNLGVKVEQVLPPPTLMETPFTRAISCMVFKSLLVHGQTFANWPESYAYLPLHGVNCYLQDFLLAIAGAQQVKGWIQSTFYRKIQQFYTEKSCSFFENVTTNNKKLLEKLSLLVESLLTELILNLSTLPDIVKTTLTVAKVCIYNFIYNVVDVISAKIDHPMKKKLEMQFPELEEIIELSDSILTKQRAEAFAQKLFRQFFNLFVGQCVIQTAFNNPVGYFLLQPNQAFLDDNVHFFSNLSFVADLMQLVMSPLRNGLVFQLSDEVLMGDQNFKYINDAAKQVLFQKEDSGVGCRQTIVDCLVQRLVNNVGPYLHAIMDEDFLYDTNSAKIVKLFSASGYQFSQKQITFGYWCASSSYLMYVQKLFINQSEYLQDNFSIMQEACGQIFNKFYEPLSQLQQQYSQNESQEAETLIYKFKQFEDLPSHISDLVDSFKDGSLVQQYIDELRANSSPYSKIAIVPIGNLSQNQQTTSILLFYQMLAEKCQHEQQNFAKNSQLEFQEDETEGNIHFIVDKYFQYVEQLVQVKSLLQQLKNLQEKISGQKFASEDEQFQFFQSVQQDVNQFTEQTSLVNSNLMQFDETAQMYDVEQDYINQLNNDIMVYCQELLDQSREPIDFDIRLDNDHYLEVHSRFAQIREQYFQKLRSPAFDEMVMNYNSMLDFVKFSVNGKQQFRTFKTIDKIFGYFISKDTTVRSSFYLQLFDNGLGSYQDIQKPMLEAIKTEKQRVTLPQPKKVDIQDVGRMFDNAIRDGKLEITKKVTSAFWNVQESEKQSVTQFCKPEDKDLEESDTFAYSKIVGNIEDKGSFEQEPQVNKQELEDFSPKNPDDI